MTGFASIVQSRITSCVIATGDVTGVSVRDDVEVQQPQL